MTLLDRGQLREEMLAHPPEPDEVVYVERRADRYLWRTVGMMAGAADTVEGQPEAWIYYSGNWPDRDDPGFDAFFDDLLAEMDSMVGNSDRCRWSTDDPWPHWH